MLPAGGANRVEVDLPRQVLQLYKDGALYKVVDVSTGSGKRYCVDGECATAVTPGGSYKVFFRRNGIRVEQARQALQPAVLQRRHRDSRRAVGARLSGVARLRAHPDVRVRRGSPARFRTARRST